MCFYLFVFESVFGQISMFLRWFFHDINVWKGCPCFFTQNLFVHIYKLWCFPYFVWGWKFSYLTKSIQHVGIKHSVRMVLNTSKFLLMIHIWMFQLVWSSQVVVMAGTVTRKGLGSLVSLGMFSKSILCSRYLYTYIYIIYVIHMYTWLEDARSDYG